MSEVAVPNHVAIIMDGNGRWAKQRGLSRTEGHKRGVDTVRSTVESAANLGIKYITLFGFSSENWERPVDEVSYLMNLIRIYMKNEIEELQKNKVRLKVIGDRSKLDGDIVRSIEKCEEETKNNDRITVTIALSYGGRQDIVSAVKKMVKDAVHGNISVEDLTTEDFSSYLSTSGIPDPDLMIRTSGEMRISNFLIWQLAYSELYFSNTLWPDFSEQDLIEAIEDYNARDRRFGKLSDKVRA